MRLADGDEKGSRARMSHFFSVFLGSFEFCICAASPPTMFQLLLAQRLRRLRSNLIAVCKFLKDFIPRQNTK